MRVSVYLAMVAGLWLGTAGAQEPEIDRPGPAPLEDFEADPDGDGTPDGWYNLRDAKLAKGGVEGPTCLRFESERPGRPSRASRAFGVDGRQTEAIVIGLWVRAERVQAGERVGDEPGLLIDLLGDQLRELGRGSLGPWTRTIGTEWVRVARRIDVPPGTRDAIMTVGLLGATGVMEIDGLTIELVPVGAKATTNLLLNGDFERGDPEPADWVIEHGAHRAFPGHRSSSALELSHARALAMNGLAMPVDRFGTLELSLMVKAVGLRGAGGAEALFFFLDEAGDPVDGQEGVRAFRWSGSFDWRLFRKTIAIPEGAVAAVLQFDTLDAIGSVRIDDVQVRASPDPQAGAWEPYHVQTDTSGWTAVSPSTRIEPGSALDASFLLPTPAGKQGFVGVKAGRLTFAQGGRARFFGVALLSPTAFQESGPADALADRLARSGINLVRLGDLDTALGPGRSLFDDTRDDTRALDPLSLSRLDHLIAALKQRGVYVALELQSARRFRDKDEVPGGRALPPGGGPAAAFDPTLRARELEAAVALLSHVNPETGLALRDDPVLAWVTLAGEFSLFDLVDQPNLLPPEPAKGLRALAQKSAAGAGLRFWQATESAHWKALAEGLRKAGLKVPIAGCSHWRRGPAEFAATQAAPSLDLIDDRLYWSPNPWGPADRRSLLWERNGLGDAAASRRRVDRPYVVGQWADQTQGAWALPYEAADQMIAVATARAEDWDALVRRGVFLYPMAWGSGATGTAGGEDFFVIPGVVNGIPPVFALWPHAASLFLRGHDAPGRAHAGSRTAVRRVGLPGLDPKSGRLLIETPFTQGVAGKSEGQVETFPTLTFAVDSPYAVVVASSIGPEPIANAKRLLVSAIARVEPTGFRWADRWQSAVASQGRPPLLREPVRAQVTWRHRGKVRAFAIDNDGARIGPADLKQVPNGVLLEIDGSAPNFHWELVAE